MARAKIFTQGGKTTTDLDAGDWTADNSGDFHCNLCDPVYSKYFEEHDCLQWPVPPKLNYDIFK